MRAYSIDLRERIIKKWQDGTSKIGIARVLEVSLNTVRRCIKQYEGSGSLERPVRKKRQKRMDAAAQERLVEQLQSHDDYTLQQHVALWAVHEQITVSVTTMWRAINAVGWTYKKKCWQPKNGRNPSVTPFVK